MSSNLPNLNRKPINVRNKRKDYIAINEIAESLSLSEIEVMKMIDDANFSKEEFKGDNFLHIEDFKQIKNTLYLTRSAMEIKIGDASVENNDFIKGMLGVDANEALEMLNEENNILLKNSNILSYRLAELQANFDFLAKNYVTAGFELDVYTRERDAFIACISELSEETGVLKDENFELANQLIDAGMHIDSLFKNFEGQEHELENMSNCLAEANEKLTGISTASISKIEKLQSITTKIINENRILTLELMGERKKNESFFSRLKNLFKGSR